MGRRPSRAERAARRREEMFTARIAAADGWQPRFGHAVDYLRAVLDEHPDAADQVIRQLAELARAISTRSRP